MLVEDLQNPSDQGSYHHVKTAQLPLSIYTCNNAFLQALCLLFSKHCGVLMWCIRLHNSCKDSAD